MFALFDEQDEFVDQLLDICIFKVKFIGTVPWLLFGLPNVTFDTFADIKFALRPGEVVVGARVDGAEVDGAGVDGIGHPLSPPPPSKFRPQYPFIHKPS